MYGTFYIAGLRRRAAELQAQRIADAAAAIADPRAVLRANLLSFQSSQTPEARAHGYLLEDIRKVIHATPQQLGVALDELGWSRRRTWSNTGPYRRRWYPPD